jgi:hypothetical protein
MQCCVVPGRALRFSFMGVCWEMVRSHYVDYVGLSFAAAAREFLQQRLHAGVKRSNDMLKPTKVAGVFVHGPKVAS